MNKITGHSEVHEDILEQFSDIISDLNRTCHERFRRQCDIFCLNEAELRCLRLFDHNRYLTAKSIALRLGVTKGRVTRIIEGLVEKTLLHRRPDPDDARVTLLSLTPEGRERREKVREHQLAVHRAVLERLSDHQRAEVLAMLTMLKGAMDAVDATMSLGEALEQVQPPAC